MIARLAIAIAAVVTVASAAACTNTAMPGARLTVFAAASLRDALGEAIEAYTRDHPEVSIELAIDSSAALRVQIEQGAPADLFLSADLDEPTRLADDGLASGTVEAFATNSVAVAVPSDNPAGLESALDLADRGVAILAANPEVPITKYTTKLVAQLAALPDAPPGFEQRYAANVVSRETNVGAIAAKLELGEADAGVVYRTDVAGSDRLREIARPSGVGVSARYGGVVIARSARDAEASAFLAWLTRRDGQAVLGRFGFGPP